MKTILFLACFAVACACSSPSVKLKFENRGAIYLPVEVEGNTYLFLFDTGRKTTVLSKQIIEDLFGKLTIGRMDSIHITMQENKTSITFKSAKGKVKLKIGDFNFSTDFEAQGNDSTNIIGMDVIGQKHWFVNLKDSTVIVSDLATRFNADTLSRWDFIYPSNKQMMRLSLRLDDTLYENILFNTGFPCNVSRHDTNTFSFGINDLLIGLPQGDPDSIFNKLKGEKRGNFWLPLPDSSKIMFCKSIKVNDDSMKFFTIKSFESNIYQQVSSNRKMYGILPFDFVAGRFSYLRINPDIRKLSLFSDGSEGTARRREVERFHSLCAGASYYVINGKRIDNSSNQP